MKQYQNTAFQIKKAFSNVTAINQVLFIRYLNNQTNHIHIRRKNNLQSTQKLHPFCATLALPHDNGRQDLLSEIRLPFLDSGHHHVTNTSGWGDPWFPSLRLCRGSWPLCCPHSSLLLPLEDPETSGNCSRHFLHVLQINKYKNNQGKMNQTPYPLFCLKKNFQ